MHTTHPSKISLQFLQGVLDVFEDAILCTGAHNEILWMNNRAQGLLNLSKVESRQDSWESFIAPRSRDDYFKHLDSFQQASDKKEKNAQFEFLGINPKNKIFPARVQFKKIKHQSTWLTVHFIQELNPQTTSLNLSLQVPSSPLAKEALQDFSYILSHQSNDPLRKILSFSERLDNGYRQQLGTKGQKYLGCMGNAVKKFQRLVDDLRVFSRISARPGNICLFPLNVIMDEVISDYETALAHSKGTIKVGELPVLEGNPNQMKILFKQLISNSLKFRNKNTAPKITLESRKTDSGLWEIIVRDNGIGFNNQHAERIFNPCERLHGNADYPGSGMGLAICRKIADRHHGTLSGRGKTGKGATFTLQIPPVSPQSEKNFLSN